MKRIPELAAVIAAILIALVASAEPPGLKPDARQELPWLMGAEAAARRDPAAASVKVVCARPDGSLFGGSGTVIDLEGPADRRVAVILTNCHVCPDEGAGVVVFWPNGRAARAEWLGVAVDEDLCLLAAADQGGAAAPLGPPPAAGAAVTQAGYPGGDGPVRRSGRVVGVHGTYAPRHAPYASAPLYEVELRAADGRGTRSGDSGSGVFDAEGRLVAVVWGGIPDTPRTSCVCPASVRSFVAESPAGERWFPRLRAALRGAGKAVAAPARAVGKVIDVARANRVPNRTGSQCVGASIETLGRHHGLKALEGFAAAHPGNCPSAASAAEAVRRSGVKCRSQDTGNRDLAILLYAARGGLGAVVGLNGTHAVTLVGYDPNERTVSLIDNQGPNALEVQTWPLSRFLGAWDGFTVVLEK